MKRLVSVLAIALVSSLLAAGCAKLTNCGEAKTAADCVEGKFEAPFTCKWNEAAAGYAEKGKCEETWTAKKEVTDACATGTDQAKCDSDAAKAATAADATATCKWEKVGAETKCNAAKLWKK